jgi:PAS domain S-box-containing protein
MGDRKPQPDAGDAGLRGLNEQPHSAANAEPWPAAPDTALTACLDGMVDGIVINNAVRDETGRLVDFRVVYANEAASRISGVAHDDLVGHRILDLFPGRRDNGQFDAYCRVVETGEPLVRNSERDHDVADRSDPEGFGRDFEVSVTKLGDGYVATLHDIVARRRAEDELFRSRQMLRLVLDSIPQRVFWKDVNSVYVGCNAPFAQDVGVADPSYVVGKTDYELASSEFAEVYMADDRAVISSGLPKLDYEDRQVRPGGDYRWVHISKAPLFDGNGRVVGVLGAYEDITDNRRAEQALKDSERFLSDILENIPTMVFVKDARDLRFARVNRAAERTMGYTRDELVGVDDQPLAPPEETAFFASVDRHVIETGEAVDVPEETLTVPRLGRRTMHTTKLPIFDDAGRVRYVLGISEDITDLKAAEEARRESEARYRDIIDTITDYVVSAKIENGRAASLSHGPGCVAVTGYSAEELSGDPDRWFNLVVDEDRDLAIDRFRRVLTGEPTGPLEHRIRRKDGSVRWVRNTPVLRFGQDGIPIAYDGVIQDITEQRALMEQLLQSQKMEGIGRLAGGVAHDFNNLLTAILGYVEMCKIDLPAELPADHPARLDLDEVATAGERAATITQQLLTFASRQIVAPRRLDLSSLVAVSTKMLQRLLGDDIKIETALDPQAGILEADPGQIQQLLVNLTVNARDAMPDGGRLTIETSEATVDEEEARRYPGAMAGPFALLTVHDTGVGMTAEVREHVFEPFFTTKELGKGTGLGLATCHGIVRQMGGHIRVYSELGLGTTFRIYLPRSAEAADAQPVPAPRTPTPAGMETVLVVEDEPHVRRLAVLALRAYGYSVLEAADGAEAIETAGRAGTVDLIVSDVMMPGISGPELLERLSTIVPGARAVLMSGHAEATILSRRPALHWAFLPKPFTPDRLAQKVREVLDAPGPR